MSTRPRDDTDLIAGVGLMAVAAFFGWQTMGLEIGTSLRMGPGYFPMILSGLLFILGLLVTIQSLGREGEPGTPLACPSGASVPGFHSEGGIRRIFRPASRWAFPSPRPSPASAALAPERDGRRSSTARGSERRAQCPGANASPRNG